MTPPIQDLYPDDFAHCFGCGRHNPHGHQLKSFEQGEEVVAHFTPSAHHIAVPGFVYGGLLASLVAAAPADVEVRSRATGWLSANPSHPQAYQLIAPLVAGNPSDTDMRSLATTWVNANDSHPQAHWLLASLVAGNPSDADVRLLATAWLDANPSHSQAYQLIASLVAGNPSDADRRSLAIAWLDANASHPQAHEVLKPLIAANPDDVDIIERSRATLECDKTPSVGRVELLRTLIIRSSANAEWLARGTAYVEQADAVNREQIIGPLLVGSKALPKYIDLALEFARQSTARQRSVILYYLLRAVVANPSAGADYLLDDTRDEDRKNTVRDSVAHAIRNSGGSPPALDCLKELVARLPPPQIGKILARVIKLDARAEVLNPIISRWLDEHFRCTGYGFVIGALKENRRFAEQLQTCPDFTARVAKDLNGASSIAPRIAITKPAAPAPRILPKAGERVEAELLAERTKKQGWKARHLATGLAGPIQDSAVVPPESKPGDRVTLTIRMATEREIAFAWFDNVTRRPKLPAHSTPR